MYFEKPVISEEDILEVLKLYIKDIPASYMISNMGGIPNSNYHFQSENIDIAIKIYSKGQSSVEHIEKEVAFIDYMQKSGVKTLTLVPGRDGNYLQFWKGYPVTCSEYITGKLLSDIIVDDSIASLVGAYTATFVRTAANYDVKMADSTDLISTIEYVFKDINRQSLSHLVLADLDYVLNCWESIISEIVVFNCSFKHQLVHMDLWPYNLIISNDSLYSIDYDDWMFTTPLFELSVVLLEFCMFKCAEFDWEKASSILAGYRSCISIDFSPNDLLLALQYLCILWYGYNLVESTDYSDAQIYAEKLAAISTESFKVKFHSLVQQEC